MSYDDAIAWLYDRGRLGVKPGLDRIRRLLDALDVEPPPRIVTVAGTNGKGTVTHLVAAAASEAGRRTGRYVSPHVHRFTERIAVDDAEIPRVRAAGWIDAARTVVEETGMDATFFEITTAVALAHFQDAGCDLAVLEVGLGGRLDATNAVDADVAVVTSIGRDHVGVLGERIPEIAREKAGIVGPGSRVVTPVAGPALDAVRDRCRRVGADLERVDPDRFQVADRRLDGWTFTAPSGRVRTRLHGDHHATNLATAEAAAGALDLPADALLDAAPDVGIPARFDVLTDAPLVADGAHNADAARALAGTWQALDLPPATLVLGLLEGKDVEAIVDALAPVADRVLGTAPDLPRRLSPDRLARVLDDRGIAHVTVPSTRDALVRADGPVLATGSFFTAGEAIRCTVEADHDPLIAL